MITRSDCLSLMTVVHELVLLPVLVSLLNDLISTVLFNTVQLINHQEIVQFTITLPV